MKLLKILILLKNGISKKWGQRPKPFGGTQSPRPETHLMGETQDLRPRTLKVGLKTQNSWVGPGTLKVGAETQDA